MVYLISFALNHITPDRQFLETVSFDALFLECEHNAASAPFAYALRDYLKDDSLFTPEQAARMGFRLQKRLSPHDTFAG